MGVNPAPVGLSHPKRPKSTAVNSSQTKHKHDCKSKKAQLKDEMLDNLRNQLALKFSSLIDSMHQNNKNKLEQSRSGY